MALWSTLECNPQEYPFVNATDIDQAMFFIEVLHDPEIKSLDDLIKLEENEQFLEYELINISKTELDQNPAYKLIFTGNNTESIFGNISNVTVMDIVSVKDHKIYRILYGQESDRYSNLLLTIEKMIDSFQILDSKDSVNGNDTTEEKNFLSNDVNQTDHFDTYANNTLGIKISYPQEWGKTSIGNTLLFFPPIRGPYLLGQIYDIAIDEPVITYDQPVDYAAKLAWVDVISDPAFSNSSDNRVSWSRVLQEYSATGQPRFVNKTSDYNISFKKGFENYVLLSFDLSTINYPKQYAMSFSSTTIFVKDGLFCMLLDTTNQVTNPPPNISVLPQSNLTSIGPNEKKMIELKVKSSSNIPTNVSLSPSDDIVPKDLVDATIFPSNLTLPSGGSKTTTLFLGAKFGYLASIGMIPSIPITVPIDTKIRFPKHLSLIFEGTLNTFVEKGFQINKPDIASLSIRSMNFLEYILHILSPLSVLVPLAGIVGGGIAWILKTWLSKKSEEPRKQSN